MSKPQTAADELAADDSANKALKAETKAAEKTDKANKKEVKEAKKAAKKLAKKAEKKVRRDGEALAKVESLKKLKTEKPRIEKSKSKSTGTASEPSGLGAKLQSVARLARGNLAGGLLAHGLYAGQEQVLFMLDEHGPLALAELAEKLDVRAPTITKTVTRMEGQSFLSRATSRDDARSIIIALTPDGRRVLKIARQIVQNVEAETFSGLSDVERQNLHGALDMVLLHSKNVE